MIEIPNVSSDEASSNREKVSMIEWFIPVGWYPTAVAVSPDNRTLLVANGKGFASRPNVPAVTPAPQLLHKPPPFDYIGRILKARYRSSGGLTRRRWPPTQSRSAATRLTRRNSFTGLHSRVIRSFRTKSGSPGDLR